jgi:hypothetical protein
MRRKCKKALSTRTTDILRSNEGASIVLVTIISVIVVASIIILSINVNTLVTSADRQYFRDQAYEAATSMGSAIDGLVNENKAPLDDYAEIPELINDTSNNINVTVKVEAVENATNTYTVIVTATSAGEEYIYTATYFGTGTTYMRIS